MKIVIFDIDDTITEESLFLRKHAPDFLKKYYKISGVEQDPYAYELENLYGLKDLFSETLKAEEKAKEAGQRFWNQNFVSYCNLALRDGVKETIQFLHSNGYEIHFVSMRGKYDPKRDRLLRTKLQRKAVFFLTWLQLKRNGIKYDVLKLMSTEADKLKYIRYCNPDFIFEDRACLIRRMTEWKDVSSKIICIDNIHNQKEVLPENVKRINRYDKSLQDYLCQNMDIAPKKRKESNMRNGLYRFTRKMLYRIIRMIGRPFVFYHFKPVIMGRNRISRQQSVVFVGNHRKNGDPIVLTAVLHQVVHWAALKRLIDGKENLFSDQKKLGRYKYIGLLLKGMGALPIARAGDTNCQTINLNTMRTFMKILREGKESVGWFPEGTLNRNPEKMEILPLKSDHIFRLALQNGSWIQPFSIVWIPDRRGGVKAEWSSVFLFLSTPKKESEMR